MGRQKGSQTGFRQIISKICEECGTHFNVEPYRSDARFCGRICKNAAHSKFLHKPDKRECLRCGKEFVTRPSVKKIYCSQSCGSKATRFGLPQHTKNRIKKRCQICDAEFERVPSQIGKFCSKKCADRSFEKKIDFTCKICGKTSQIRAKLRDRKYCSRSCRTIGIGKTESYLEKKMAKGLKDARISFVAQMALGPYTVDFAIPERKIIIECDGNYWHSLPDTIRRDHRKNKFFKNRGWHVLRFSETQIVSNFDSCISTIADSLKLFPPLS